MLYAHRATRNEPTAHIQMAMPSETVTKRVGTSTSSAAPIQKREKRRAVPKDKRIVAIEKEAKRAMGVKERRNWMKRKDCCNELVYVPKVTSGTWILYSNKRLLSRESIEVIVELLSCIPAYDAIRDALNS